MSEFSDFEDEEGVEEPALSGDEQTGPVEEEIDDNPLSQDVIEQGLSLLCKTGNALSHAYVRLDVHHRDITDISILACFLHLRYIDLSGNKLKDASPLNHLQHLLTLKIDLNLLKSPQLNELPFLQQADFSSNKITDTEGIEHPMLEQLNLNGNELTEVGQLNRKKLTRLRVIEFRGNRLTTTEGLGLPNIQKIYLGENMIKTIEGLAELEHLTTLYLRHNDISTLDGFSENMKNLQYLNLRKNNIESMHEVSKLKCLPMLRALILRENPICNDESYRVEVLVILRRLERLDQDTFNEDERSEAEEISTQRAEAEMEGDEEEVAELIHSEDDED